MGNEPAFVMPGYDADIEASRGWVEWLREADPILAARHCIHGRYMGFNRVFLHQCEPCLQEKGAEAPLEAAFQVEVDFTDRTRAEDGTYTTWTRTVDIWAAGNSEATYLAATLVHCLICDIDGMVLATRIVGVKI